MKSRAIDIFFTAAWTFVIVVLVIGTLALLGGSGR